MNVFSGLGLTRALTEEASRAGMKSDRMGVLAASMARHLVHSKSDSTVTKNFSAYTRWEDFIKSEDSTLSALPAKPIQVALYITHLIDNGGTVSVIQSAIYGIKWAHKLRGLCDPTDDNYITNLLQTVKRCHSKPVVKKDIIDSDKYSGTEDILILRLGHSSFEFRRVFKV